MKINKNNEWVYKLMNSLDYREPKYVFSILICMLIRYKDFMDGCLLCRTEDEFMEHIKKYKELVEEPHDGIIKFARRICNEN